MEGAFEVRLDELFSAATRSERASVVTRSAGAIAYPPADVGAPVLAAALAEFDSIWADLGRRLSDAADAVPLALVATAMSYLEADSGASEAMGALQRDVNALGGTRAGPP